MGEEGKKTEETKMEEKKTEEPKKGAEEEKKEGKEEKPAGEEKKPEESKDAKESKEEAAPPPPPPPPEIVLKVFMHCEGCARKVRRSLTGFPGVEDVITDCKTHKVVVKGEKADPMKVLERVQKKSHGQVELLSPIPKPPAPEEEQKSEGKEQPKPEEKKEQVITVVLQVYMHCEACSQEIKRRIQRMKGVESAEPDLKSSQVSVKGVFDPAELVEFVRRRTGKQAVIVKQEPEKKKEESKKGKEEKKGEEDEKEENKGNNEGEENKKENKGEEGGDKSTKATTEEIMLVDVKKSEYYYNPATFGMEYYSYPYPGPDYPPQIFSDENPNACSVM